MATRSLGSLTLDLLARIGGFTQGMDRAARVADQKSREIARVNQRRARETQQAWQSATRFIQSAFLGISVAGVMRTFIQNTINAQNEQAQLAAVLRSTGNAAGFTADQLNSMASELSGRSVFSEGEINSAQTRLLSYTGIVGEQFPQAMQAVIDMAARMGMSLEQSAETIGRALDIPSAGLTALSRQGFRFTEEQKKLIKALEDTGRVAEAQGILLEALQSSYGGAAQAARDTFGGAVQALRNEISTLMTGKDGSLDGARQSVEDLVQALRDPNTKEAFSNLAEAIFSITSALVTATRWFVTFGQAVGFAAARAAIGSIEPLERLDEQIMVVERSIRNLQERMERPAMFRRESVEQIRAQLEQLQQRLDTLRRTRDAVLSDLQRTPPAIAAVASPTAPRRPPPRIVDPEEERAARRAAEAARRYLENLQAQLRATENLSVAETVLRDIQEGRLRLAGGVSQQQLLDIARQIDAHRQMTDQLQFEEQVLRKVRDERKRLADEGRSVFEATRTPIEQLNVELARLQSLLDKGAIDWDTYGRAVFAAQDAFEATQKTVEKTRSVAEELGMTFSSAFEDAIVEGRRLQDVLKGILQDILRITVRRNITNPLADAIGGFDFGGFFRGIFGLAKGGPAFAGTPYIVGEKGPELFVPKTSGYVVPNDGSGEGGSVLGGFGEVNIYNNARANVRAERGSGGGLNIFIDEVLGAVAGDIANGGRVATAMQGTYGLNRGAGAPRLSR